MSIFDSDHLTVPETVYPENFEQINPDDMTIVETFDYILKFFKLNEKLFHPFVSNNGVRYSAMLNLDRKMMILMLKSNIENNRHPDASNIRAIKHNIASNRWIETNGTQLMFFPNGQLSDGQTRLFSMIELKVPNAWFRVGYNHDSNDLFTIDLNKIRTALESVTVAGTYTKTTKGRDKSAKQMIKFIHCYDNNFPSKKFGINDRAVKFDAFVFQKYVEEFNEKQNLLFPCFEYAREFPAIKPGNVALLAYCYFVAKRKYDVVADSFFAKLKTDEENDMLLQLRRFLADIPISKNHTFHEYNIFKTLYYYINNMNMSADELSIPNNDLKFAESQNYRPDYI